MNDGSNAHFLSLQVPLSLPPTQSFPHASHRLPQTAVSPGESGTALGYSAAAAATPARLQQGASASCSCAYSRHFSLPALPVAVPELLGLGQHTRHLGRGRAGANAVLRRFLRAFSHGRPLSPKQFDAYLSWNWQFFSEKWGGWAPPPRCEL